MNMPTRALGPVGPHGMLCTVALGGRTLHAHPWLGNHCARWQGWKLFAEAHNVQPGDQYMFELVGSDRLVIQLLSRGGSDAGAAVQATSSG